MDRLSGVVDGDVALLTDMRQRISANGFELWTSTPEEFAKVIRADRDRWGKIVAASGAKVD